MNLHVELQHSPTQTLKSHGWVLLKPFRYNEEKSILAWPMNLPVAGPSDCIAHIDEKAKTVSLECDDRVDEVDIRVMISAVRRMFRADEDLSKFWNRIDEIAADELKYVVISRAGALLRAPTVFEDLVKTLLTVNCTWSNTELMVSNLCKELGQKIAAKNLWTFPEPNAIAKKSESEIRSIGLGFRSRYVHSAATAFVNNPKLEARWETLTDSDILREEITKFPGVGPYAGNHMLMMLGHYSYVPADSITRNYLGISVSARRNTVDQEVNRRFAKWGDLAALAYHFTRKQNSTSIPDK